MATKPPTRHIFSGVLFSPSQLRSSAHRDLEVAVGRTEGRMTSRDPHLAEEKERAERPRFGHFSLSIPVHGIIWSPGVSLSTSSRCVQENAGLTFCRLGVSNHADVDLNWRVRSKPTRQLRLNTIWEFPEMVVIPRKWMVYLEKSTSNEWFGVPPIRETTISTLSRSPTVPFFLPYLQLPSENQAIKHGLLEIKSAIDIQFRDFPAVSDDTAMFHVFS